MRFLKTKPESRPGAYNVLRNLMGRVKIYPVLDEPKRAALVRICQEEKSKKRNESQFVT